MARRRPVPEGINKVLLHSKRRCCICYSEGTHSPVEGHIAHLKTKHSMDNVPEGNLVYLCLQHHADLDAGKLSIDDVVAARRKLYKALEQEDKQKQATLPRWQKYQHKVIESLRNEMFEDFGDRFSFNTAASLKGRSGLLRDADIAIGIRALSYDLLILVEIKYSTRALTVTDVESAGIRFQDLGAAKGIIVCNSGFTPEAIQRAESMAIGLRHIEADPEIFNVTVSDKITFTDNFRVE